MLPDTRNSLALALAVLLAGCAVGPDFKTPDAPKAVSYPGADQEWVDSDQRLVSGMPVAADWWVMFGSDELNSLVNRALASANSVSAARARLRAAEEELNSQVGAVLYPSVDGNASVARQKISGVSFGGNPRTYTLHNASVSASYGLDLFGASARYLEILEANIDYQQYQLHAARLTLGANLVTAAVKEATLRAQIVATETIIGDNREMLAMIDKRYELGAVPVSAVLAQRAALAQSRTALPGLQKQLQQNRHLMNALAGDLPTAESLPEFTLEGLHLPVELPLSLPSELVRQRPDIMASEALLHQANANVGLATANLYPSITLSAGYGAESRTASGLFGPAGGTVWSAGAGLVQPLVHGGELRAKKRGAEAGYAEAEANYRQTVLDAFRDVADTLMALKADAEGLALQREAERAAYETYALMKVQYRAGAASYLDLLNASQQYQQAVIGRVQAEATRLADSAALVHALGGGWWNDLPAQDAAVTENES